MMQLSLHSAADHIAVRAFHGDAVVIGDDTYRESILFSPAGPVTPWPATDVLRLEDAHIAQLMEGGPEVVILGTGNRLRFPQTTVMAAFHERRIGLEVMANDAACRTYNVLASEARDVRAALIFSS